MISTFFATIFLNQLRSRQPTIRKWITHVIVGITTLFTFYLEALFVITQNILATTCNFSHPRWLKPWFIAQLSIAAPVIIWVISIGLTPGTYRPTATIPDIASALNALTLLTVGDAFPYHGNLLTAIYPAILALAVLQINHSFTRRSTLYITTYIFIPVALLTALALITSQGFFRARYIAPVSPLLMILLAAALANKPGQHYRNFLSVTLTGLVLTCLLISGLNYLYNPAVAKAPPWRDLMGYLHAQVSARDIVIQNYPDPAFTYYFNANTPTTIIPSQVKSPHTRTQTELTAATTNRDYVWFLPTPSASWDADQYAYTWLNMNMQSISDHWIGNLHLIKYGSPHPSVTAIHVKTNVVFQDTAILEGYNIDSIQNIHPADTITIELFFTPKTQTLQPLTIFTHVLTTELVPQLIAQDDHPPQHQPMATTNWTVNELIRDVVSLTIPAQTPPGTYLVSVGFYNNLTNRRIPISTTLPKPEPDGAQLFSIQIVTN